MKTEKTTLSDETVDGGISRFASCIVPPELGEQLREFADFELILHGQKSKALQTCGTAITQAFGENPPLFAKHATTELNEEGNNNPNNILFLRFIIAAKILMIFGLKFLSENNLWAKSGLAEVKHFKNPDHPHAIAARRKYFATIAAEILSKSPARDDSDQEQSKIHQRGWKLSNVNNPETAPNCVSNGARLAVGIAQAAGWDNLLLSNMAQDCTGKPAKHIDSIITDSNPMAWEYFDTYNTQFGRLASALPLSIKGLEKPPAPTEVVECTLSEAISVLTGLPRRSFITDPLTGLTVVNLHHAAIAVDGETFTDTHKLLAKAGHAISPELFGHLSEKLQT